MLHILQPSVPDWPRDADGHQSPYRRHRCKCLHLLELINSWDLTCKKIGVLQQENGFCLVARIKLSDILSQISYRDGFGVWHRYSGCWGGPQRQIKRYQQDGLVEQPSLRIKFDSFVHYCLQINQAGYIALAVDWPRKNANICIVHYNKGATITSDWLIEPGCASRAVRQSTAAAKDMPSNEASVKVTIAPEAVTMSPTFIIQTMNAYSMK